MTTAGIDFQLQVVRADLVCKATDTYNNILNDSLIFENLSYGAYNGMAWLIGGAPVYKSIELGMSNHHMIFVFDLTVVEEKETEDFKLQIRPNPFASSLTIEYRLEKSSHVVIEIRNLNGNIVTILTDAWQPAGQHRTEWHENGNDGRLLPSGSYILVFRANEQVYSRILLRK